MYKACSTVLPDTATADLTDFFILNQTLSSLCALLNFVVEEAIINGSSLFCGLKISLHY